MCNENKSLYYKSITMLSLEEVKRIPPGTDVLIYQRFYDRNLWGKIRKMEDIFIRYDWTKDQEKRKTIVCTIDDHPNMFYSIDHDYGISWYVVCTI